MHFLFLCVRTCVRVCAPAVNGSAAAMPMCCVLGCTGSYRGNQTQRSFSRAPSYSGFRVAMYLANACLDRNLSDKLRVCDMHFYPEDTENTYTYFINGEKVEAE